MSEKSSIPASWDPERNFLDSFRSSRRLWRFFESSRSLWRVSDSVRSSSHLPEQQRPDSPGLSMSEKSKRSTPHPASAEIPPKRRVSDSVRSSRRPPDNLESSGSLWLDVSEFLYRLMQDLF